MKALTACLLLAVAAHAAPIVPKDGMVIRRSVTLKPGVYALPHGLVIGANAVTLDGNGATLVGAGKGQAVLAVKRTGVTVRNLRIQSYRWGIRMDGAVNPVIEGCRVRDTAEERPDDVWLDIWAGPKDAYGAAVILLNATGGVVQNNDIQHQQNGVSLYNCRRVNVEGNNASFQSGWGIHLNGSSDCLIEGNLADWCNRIHKRGPREYYPGADAAGLLMVANCNRNTIRRNYFRGGGDGVFVAGFHPTLGKVPCDDNLFEDNDGSLSPNNAFECTFCHRNTFRNNRANTSNYGFWLGYSTDTTVTANEMRRNRVAGVAIEHGLRNVISKNRFIANTRGTALWSRADAGFLEAFKDQAASASNSVTENTFTANGAGLLIRRDGEAPTASPHDDSITGNTFVGNQIGALLIGAATETLSGNLFQNNSTAAIRLEGGRAVAATGNAFVGNPVWADAPAAWAGNYWKDAKPEGPDPGTDASPLAAPPMPAVAEPFTQLDNLRATPR
ncbi:MAG TPA: NosD domain-containing protein [Armatimonadota bacterium]